MASSGTIKHLWALDAPMLKVDKSIMILGAGGELVLLPSPSFLIEHAEHGLLLFDTGLAGAGDPASTYGPLAELFMIEFPAERALDRQLESLGFSTADVKRVVISHLHSITPAAWSISPVRRDTSDPESSGTRAHPTITSRASFGRKTSTRPIGSTGAKCLPDTTTTCSGTAASSCSRCPDTRRVRSG